jgi:hypothetical protein
LWAGSTVRKGNPAEAENVTGPGLTVNPKPAELSVVDVEPLAYAAFSLSRVNIGPERTQKARTARAMDTRNRDAKP